MLCLLSKFYIKKKIILLMNLKSWTTLTCCSEESSKSISIDLPECSWLGFS